MFDGEESERLEEERIKRMKLERFRARWQKMTK